MHHPYYDEYWQGKVADLAAIDVPAYVVASWTDHGLHTRGTLEAFRRMASPHKWLEVHGREKWAYFYAPGSVARQTAFFDRFLKDQPNQVDTWPPVRLDPRTRQHRKPPERAGMAAHADPLHAAIPGRQHGLVPHRAA